MAMEVKIHKKLGEYELDVHWKSTKKRIGILGASGSGKSMTLRSIAGIETPDSGRIIINGKTVFDSEAKINLKPQERRVGYLFQNYALFPTMTVEKNIACGYRGEKSELSQKVADYIKRYHLEGLEKHLPSQLSGGQQQRTSIGRAIIKNPSILLCDEPTGALDYHTSKEILKLIEDVNQKYGNTVIMVTHNDAIKNMADRVIRLRDGQIRKNYVNETKIAAGDLDW